MELTEREMIAAGFTCSGCGSNRTIAQIKKTNPEALSCCPERKLVPPILVPSSDHSYQQASLSETKVVWNRNAKEYFEYVGDDYLEEGEVVITARVAQ